MRRVGGSRGRGVGHRGRDSAGDVAMGAVEGRGKVWHWLVRGRVSAMRVMGAIFSRCLSLMRLYLVLRLQGKIESEA